MTCAGGFSFSRAHAVWFGRSLSTVATPSGAHQNHCVKTSGPDGTGGPFRPVLVTPGCAAKGWAGNAPGILDQSPIARMESSVSCWAHAPIRPSSFESRFGLEYGIERYRHLVVLIGDGRQSIAGLVIPSPGGNGAQLLGVILVTHVPSQHIVFHGHPPLTVALNSASGVHRHRDDFPLPHTEPSFRRFNCIE
jgi:hypothetical protein